MRGFNQFFTNLRSVRLGRVLPSVVLVGAMVSLLPTASLAGPGGGGSDTFGLYRGSNTKFYYTNSLTGPGGTGNPVVENPSGTPFGALGDTPLVGDWDGS